MENAMPSSPVEVVQAILAHPTNPDVVDALVATDATYVSLNYDNPDLRRIMPWCGTHISTTPTLQWMVLSPPYTARRAPEW